MTEKNDLVYLKHILDAIAKIEEYTYSHIPWKKITGMRDKLIHDYFGVDIDAVWDTLRQDVPALKRKVEKIVREAEG